MAGFNLLAAIFGASVITSRQHYVSHKSCVYAGYLGVLTHERHLDVKVRIGHKRAVGCDNAAALDITVVGVECA